MAIFRRSVYYNAVYGYVYEFQKLFAPTVLTTPSPVSGTQNEQIATFLISDTGDPINFIYEFYISPTDSKYGTGSNAIVTYNQFTVDSHLWDKPQGYNSGEMAIFSLPNDSPVYDYDFVRFKVGAITTSAVSGYSITYEMSFSDLTPGVPEVIDGLDQTFKWHSASEFPDEANDLMYKMQLYDVNHSALSAFSAISAASYFSVMSWMDALSGNFGLGLMSVLMNASSTNNVSYNQALSAMLQGGMLDLCYESDWIGGQYSNTYWQLMSIFSGGSYLTRVGVFDEEINSMVWSLLGSFSSVGGSKTITFYPGFNLYSLPLKDLDADTARKLMQIKVGYKYNGTPYLTEVIKWNEEGEEDDKWESVVAARSEYSLTGDFDIEENGGYFINLDYNEPISINFRGEKWI